MNNKLMKRDLRKMGACRGGRDAYAEIFPRGAELTYENVFKVVSIIYSDYIYWYLRRVISEDVADRYNELRNKCFDRDTTLEQDKKHMARWLFNVLTKFVEKGGDLSIESEEIKSLYS